MKNPVNVSTMEKALTDGSHGVWKGPSDLIPEPLHSDGYCLFGKHLTGFKVHLPDDPATMLFKSQLCQPLELGIKNRQVARKFHCSFIKNLSGGTLGHFYFLICNKKANNDKSFCKGAWVAQLID